MNYSKLLNVAAEPELCDAAQVEHGSTYASVIRSLIGTVTQLRRQAQQPVAVRVNWDNGERVVKILSDHIWLGRYPPREELEFLVGVSAILPRSSYTEEEIKNSPRAVDARAVIAKLLAEDEAAPTPLPEEPPKKIN